MKLQIEKIDEVYVVQSGYVIIKTKYHKERKQAVLDAIERLTLWQMDTK